MEDSAESDSAKVSLDKIILAEITGTIDLFKSEIPGYDEGRHFYKLAERVCEDFGVVFFKENLSSEEELIKYVQAFADPDYWNHIIISDYRSLGIEFPTTPPITPIRAT